MKILELQDLLIGYKKPILQEVNASVNQGDICVILGRNGSGKSTLIKTILKSIPKIKGNIKINNVEIESFNFELLSQIISVVYSQNILENEVNVYNLVALGRYPYKKWYEKLNKKDSLLIEKAIDYCGISSILNLNANELSDGNRQKVFIARAIVQNTPILILDEPLSYLDVENQFVIMKIFEELSKNENKTILFTSHEWDQSLTIANKMWYINENQLTSGMVEDVAIEKNIINAFSNEHFEFNFYLNKFVPILKQKSVKSVCVICSDGKDEQIYWLTRALRKNNILLDENSEIQIITKEKHYVLKENSSDVSFKNIEDLINYLKINE